MLATIRSWLRGPRVELPCPTCAACESEVQRVGARLQLERRYNDMAARVVGSQRIEIERLRDALADDMPTLQEFVAAKPLDICVEYQAEQ